MARRESSRSAAAVDEESPETKSARTRARILDAAAKVLSTKGYSGMRLVDVAKVASLQAPAIYYYFDSREDLIEQVMWVGIADMCEHLTNVLDALPDGTPPLDRILTAVEAHLRHELEISDYATASIRNAGQLPDNLRKRQIEEENKYGEIWHDLMKRAHEEGTIRADLNLYIAQMLVLGSLNWTAEWWNPKRGTIDQVVDNAQSFVRHALT